MHSSLSLAKLTAGALFALTAIALTAAAIAVDGQRAPGKAAAEPVGIARRPRSPVLAQHAVESSESESGRVDRRQRDARPRPGDDGPASVLKTYPLQEGPEQVATRLRARYARLGNVRIAADAPGGRLVVHAPLEVQRDVAAWLAARQKPRRLPPAEAAPVAEFAPLPTARPDVAATPPSRVVPVAEQRPASQRQAESQRTLSLQNLRGRDLHRTLSRLLQRPLPLTSDPREDSAHFALELAPGARVDVAIDPERNRVELDGPPNLVESWARVIAALDASQAGADDETRLVRIQNSPRLAVRQAINALQSGGRSDRLTSMLFQPAAGDDTPAAAQPGAGGAEAAAQPGGAGIAEGGLVGRVQVEILEGLDVIVIRGQKRDVARVMEILNQIEQLSAVTEPEIEVLPLAHVGSESVAELVRTLYAEVFAPRQGGVSITPLVKPNSLLLIGRKENVATARELAGRLDVPVDAKTQLRTFRLKHASALDAKTTIDEFLEERAGLGTQAVVTADFRSNSLVVQASPRDIAEVELLVARLDVPKSAAVNELRVFQLSNSLAEELAPILQDSIQSQADQAQGQQGGDGAAARSTMLRFLTIDGSGQEQLNSGILTDVRITADPRANAIIVSAPGDSMELIAALVRQLDGMPAAESQIKVFTIANGDALALIETLDALFGEVQQAAGDDELTPLRFSVDQRTNSIIASGARDDLAVVEAILLRLDDSDVDQRKSTVYRLKNAPAVDVAAAVNELLRSERQLEEAAPGLVSPFEQIEREVVVVPEPVSNSLIVSATPRYFEEVRVLVEQLDERPPMVMIQVLIAEVLLNDAHEFGVELGLQDSLLFDRSLLEDIQTTSVVTTDTTPGGAVTTVQEDVIQSAMITPGFNFNNQPLGNSGSDNSLATATKVAGQALSTFALGRVNSELGFGGLVLSASSENVSLLLRALKEDRRIEVLSRPQVMTLDNQPAFIQVGQRVPLITGVQINETGQVNTVQLENVGLILGVTPRISPDGLVVMEIDAERSEVGSEAEGIPISISATGDVVRQPRINTITTQTTVSAVDGQTVVLGGLITKNESEVHRRVPWIGEIPLLGDLFRYDSVIERRSELLIIMTPRIVRNEEDAELIKHVEACRMSWCVSDVVDMHGPLGSHRHPRQGTEVIYPGVPPGAEVIYPDLPKGAQILEMGPETTVEGPLPPPVESLPRPTERPSAPPPPPSAPLPPPPPPRAPASPPSAGGVSPSPSDAASPHRLRLRTAEPASATGAGNSARQAIYESARAVPAPASRAVLHEPVASPSAPRSTEN